MKKVLHAFKKTEIGIAQLKETLGNDLYNVHNCKPETVHAKDVIFLIEKFLSKEIPLEAMLDWVNVIWFTDLYQYASSEEESIASVMSFLEMLDEPEVEFSKEDYEKMIASLNTNQICDLE